MAGRGPAPKDPSKRARRNQDVVQLRVVEVTAAAQPPLLAFDVNVEKKDPETDEIIIVKEPFHWPEATRNWWAMLDHHPLRGEFTDLDWSYLMETALIHARFWSGAISMASELRLREAKYGFTPEDRSRLRLQFAQAVSAEVETSSKVERALSSRDRMQGITRKDSA